MTSIETETETQVEQVINTAELIDLLTDLQSDGDAVWEGGGGETAEDGPPVREINTIEMVDVGREDDISPNEDKLRVENDVPMTTQGELFVNQGETSGVIQSETLLRVESHREIS